MNTVDANMSKLTIITGQISQEHAHALGQVVLKHKRTLGQSIAFRHGYAPSQVAARSRTMFSPKSSFLPALV